MKRFGSISKWLEQFTDAVLGRNNNGDEEVTATRDMAGLYLLYALAYTVQKVRGTTGVTKTQRWAIITMCHHLQQHRKMIPEELGILGNACTSDVRVNNMVRLLRFWAEDVLRDIAKEQAAAGKEQFIRLNRIAWDKLPEDGLDWRPAEQEASRLAQPETVCRVVTGQPASNTPLPVPN